MREPIEVLVPQMNPNDEHAVLVCWHIDVGKPIRRGDPLATLETTKSTFDVEAPRDGYVFYEAAPKTLMAVGAPIGLDLRRKRRAVARFQERYRSEAGGRRGGRHHAESSTTHARAWAASR